MNFASGMPEIGAPCLRFVANLQEYRHISVASGSSSSLDRSLSEQYQQLVDQPCLSAGSSISSVLGQFEVGHPSLVVRLDWSFLFIPSSHAARHRA